MKFLQDLILAIFLPRKSRTPVKFKLTKAQQKKVLNDCRELNEMIQEVHDNLSNIRAAGSETIKLTKKCHETNLEGRKTLQQQKNECERINQELKKIADDMRAVRENVALSSKKTYQSYHGVKSLEKKVFNFSAKGEEEKMEPTTKVVPFPVSK